MRRHVLSILSFLFIFNLAFAKAEENANQMPPTLVEAIKATRQPWQKEIHATGTLSANQGIIVKPEVEGRITKIFFKSGQNVQAGAPLLQTNPDVLQAELDFANSQLILSQGDMKRAQDLYKKKVLSTAELDRAMATYNSAKANATKAQAQLNLTLIRAPFSGRLGLNLVNVGDYISVGQNLVSLQSVDPMRVEFSVSEIYINDLALGQTVIVRANAYPNQTFMGKVYAFDSLIDANTRSLAMRASIPNKDQKLVPGTFVEVTLLAGTKENLITVPQIAIVNSAEGNFVFRVVNNHAVKTAVKTGAQRGTDISILDGLTEGDIVVTAGQIKLQDGAPVMIKK